jgi:hypothetical protein
LKLLNLSDVVKECRCDGGKVIADFHDYKLISIADDGEESVIKIPDDKIAEVTNATILILAGHELKFVQK